MKILNFGSLNIDYTYDVDHFVQSGETISSLMMQTFTGGKGLNQSVAASRSGAEVWHAGAIGKNDGGFLLDLMQNAGVHTEYISRVEGPTGHAVIQREPSGQNCILLYGGANQMVTEEQVRNVVEHFAPGDWLILQNETSCVGEIMTQAHRKGLRIVWNPSPMNEKIAEYPIEYVDLLILNEMEATGICPDSVGNPKMQLDALQKKFPECTLVLTLGKKGAWYLDREKRFFQPSFQVPTVDTTGAGDTFTGFLLGALVRGDSPESAMREATAAAAIAVSRPGAAPSIPLRSDVLKFLQENV